MSRLFFLVPNREPSLLQFAFGILTIQLFQHVDLQFGRFPVFLHVLDDLQGEALLSKFRVSFHNKEREKTKGGYCYSN